jgi:hypothetical protein
MLDQLPTKCDKMTARLRERQSANQQLLAVIISQLLNEV